MFVNEGRGKHGTWCMVPFTYNYNSWQNIKANLKHNELKLSNKANKNASS